MLQSLKSKKLREDFRILDKKTYPKKPEDIDVDYYLRFFLPGIDSFQSCKNKKSNRLKIINDKKMIL